MEVKFDLAATIKMMVDFQVPGFDKAIAENKNLIRSAVEGLETSRIRLEEAEADGNEKNAVTIKAYIKWLHDSIDQYRDICIAYQNLKALNEEMSESMNEALKND